VIVEKMQFEKNLIIEEVQSLLRNGYKSRHAKEVVEGMAYAESEFNLQHWASWSDLSLCDVIELFYHYGRR
jgi:hypothetical protein